MNDKLLIFAAPSGSGKTTLVRHLLSKYKNLAFSISATTRDKRDYETDGVDYHFLTLENFKAKIENNEFVEYEEVYSNKFYGTLKSEVERIWSNNCNAIFDTDVFGGIALKEKYKDKALSVFVKTPSLEILKERLIARKTETTESLEKRLQKVAYESTFQNQFDIILLNDNLTTACQKVEELYEKFTK